MEKEQQISNDQALEVIKQMIENSKKKQRYAGFYHLLWGILVSLAIITMYLLIKNEMYNFIGWSWGAYSAVGAVVSSIYSKKHYDSKRVNYPDIGISATWSALMVSMIFVCFIFPYLGAYSWEIVFVMVSFLLGSANFVTGKILKENLPISNGIIWWLGSIALLLVKDYTLTLALFVGLLFINNIVPGIFLLLLDRKNNEK